jgi:ElaB/YqjD/DUF883 family membrane-anchored ribosome-binding protein
MHFSGKEGPSTPGGPFRRPSSQSADKDMATSQSSDAVEAASEAMEDLGRQGREAMEAAHDAWSDLDDALRRTVRERPYTALLCAGAVGFLYLVIRR